MTIEEKQKIDVISISEDETTAIMTISDHLSWEKEEEHLLLLQNKINVYLGTIENGEIYEVYPLSKNKKFTIRIYAKYDLTENAKQFIDKVRGILEKAGYGFIWKLHSGSQGQ